MVLLLTLCHEYFKLAFEKLNFTAVWLQLHHLPIKDWEMDMLEHIGSHFGGLPKVDDFILEMSRAKFTRIYVEIDLSKPL